MKKIASFFIASVLAVSLAGCGGVVDLNTPKSEELSAQYDYYSDSMNTIRGQMSITPEQADDVFIVLVSCGLDGKINTVSESNGVYKVRWGTNTLEVTMSDDGTVSGVSDGKDVLYPEYQKANILLDRDVKTADVKSGSGDVIGQYAYISVLKSQLEEITEDNFKEFIEQVVQNEEYKDFNYILIKCDDGTGVLFSEKSAIIVSYGELNDSDMIEKTVGYISQGDDGAYTYEQAK